MRRIFLQGEIAKAIGKNAGVAVYGEALRQFHMPLHMKCAIGEVDKSRCIDYF